MGLRVAFLAAECEPWAKTGGLADVVDALARALGRLPGDGGAALDAPVDVFLPRHRDVPVPVGARREAPLRVPDPVAPDGATTVSIVDVDADGYRLRLVDHPPAFDRDGYYDHPDDAWRFGLFCAAAVEAMRRDPRPPDVLHLHDWHTGPLLIRRSLAGDGDPLLARLAAVLTVHNLAYRGRVPPERVGQLGLPDGSGVGDEDGVVLLREAIARADLVTTVSPTFARQALTPEFGWGSEDVLRAKGDRFLGILNGLDPAVWDPATDDALAARYDRADPSGKARCRADLLERIGADPGDDGPLVGMVGRLDPQKGFDILSDAAPALLERGARIVVLGTGQDRFAEPFRALAGRHPSRLALFDTFDRATARRIYAGADVFAMPSRFEPCGQGQMIAMRYGTPPIVHLTGGLRDSVVDETASPGRGTGFGFEEPTPEALIEACERAFALRADAERWAALRDRAMATDFRWEAEAAPRYVEAYRRAVALRRAD